MLDVRVVANSVASYAALQELAGWADTIDFAYAWASSSGGSAAHWAALPLDRVRRAILGIHFAQTEPHILRALRELGVLRVIADTGGVFHPKAIIGIKGTKARALVGSSNFTRGGFAGNTEINVLISGAADHDSFRQLLDFMEDQWSHPRAFEPDNAWLEQYERLYEIRPVPPKWGTEASRPRRVVDKIDDLNLDWPAFVDLISHQERRSLWTGWKIHVFDHPEGSYLQEVEACQEAFMAEPSYADMPEEDRKLVAGWGGRTAGYFGRMKGAGYFKNITRERPWEIEKHLARIPLHGPVRVTQARAYLGGLLAVKGIALGAATRLLCMKRPDMFLPANNANLVNIHRVFGITPNTSEKYLALIETIWQFPWFSAPKPIDATGARLWEARVALLDAIFYEPPEYLK